MKVLKITGISILVGVLLWYFYWDSTHYTVHHFIVKYLDGSKDEMVVTTRNNNLRPVLEAGCIKWYEGNAIVCGVKSFDHYEVLVQE